MKFMAALRADAIDRSLSPAEWRFRLEYKLVEPRGGGSPGAEMARKQLQALVLMRDHLCIKPLQ